MSKVKVTVRMDIKGMLENLLDKPTAQKLHEDIQANVKMAMSTGLSPVKSAGRFEKYKHPDKYPGNRKQKRPVNLKLTGNLYKSFGYKLKNKVFEWGISKDSAVENVLNYASVHNDGNKTTSKRAFIPNKDGEEFIVTIMLGIKKILSERLAEIIKLSNK